MPDLVEKFGAAVGRQIAPNPAAARAMLLAAYRAKGAQLALLPAKELSPARQQIARLSMDAMLAPLTHPSRAALVNIFLPCELLQAFGLHPLFAEALACYLTGAGAEKGFIAAAESAGIPATYCSYHKALLGAGLSGVLPKPLFAACSSLACDANNLTFRRLAQHYGVPQFYLEVPYARDEAAVREVAEGLRGFAAFLARVTRRPLDPAALRAAVARSGRTLALLQKAQLAKAGRVLQTDITSEFYEVFVTHTLLGTPGAERYAQMLLNDLTAAPRAGAGGPANLLWVHAIPYSQPPVRALLNHSAHARLVACDMNLDTLPLAEQMDPDRPFESMARRLVYNSFNGGCEHRIARARAYCAPLGVDGAVYFNHWGCKQTQGGAQLFRAALEADGVPVLLLDGDGCDRANTSDGQTATRLGAFVEQLQAKKGARV